MLIFPTSDEAEEINVIPNRWVEFTRAWDWEIPGRKGRAVKHFKAGVRRRLTREQFQSAMAAGVAVSIPNPRARAEEATHGSGGDP